MPFLALEPASRESRLAEAAARWDALLAARPDLEPAVALQRQLIGLVVELAQTIEHGRLPRLSLPHEQRRRSPCATGQLTGKTAWPRRAKASAVGRTDASVR